MSGAMLELTGERRSALTRLVSAWLEHRGRAGRGGGPTGGAGGTGVELRQVEVLRAGRPGVLDVLAEVGGCTAHAVLGLHRPGEEPRFLRRGDEAVLGIFEDDDGLGVVVDALREAVLAAQVLGAVTGDPWVDPTVTSLADEDAGVVLGFDDRCEMTVFPWVCEGPHPGVELLVALDEEGFNHLAAPLALWRRTGRDLGVVQEQLAGSAGGWALALTSLRDLYASGGPPEEAGGDFGPEARALGTMTARMHLALDRAFGRDDVEIAELVAEVEGAVEAVRPELIEQDETSAAVAALRAAELRCAALRTHGDFHLGRTARTDQGWVVAGWAPEGTPGAPDGDPGPRARRSPLADVADLLWSLHHVATIAAAERDPTGRWGLVSLARAWEARNRRAFLAGYLATPGIGGLVPSDREVVRNLTALFELGRAVTRSAQAEG